MESTNSAGTIKELIGEINLLRKHISWSTLGVPSQINREIQKVKGDVIKALEGFHTDDLDRRYIEKSFMQLGQLNEDMSKLDGRNEDPNKLKQFLDKLDRKCCGIQIYLSDLDLPVGLSGKGSGKGMSIDS